MSTLQMEQPRHRLSGSSKVIFLHVVELKFEAKQ